MSTARDLSKKIGKQTNGAEVGKESGPGIGYRNPRACTVHAKSHASFSSVRLSARRHQLGRRGTWSPRRSEASCVEPATAARSVSSRETDGRVVESAADDRTPGQTDEASTGRTLLALHTHTQTHTETCVSITEHDNAAKNYARSRNPPTS